MSSSESTSTTGTGTNQYLAGNYAPVAEEITALDLPVEGELPVELNGRYLRNGPNPASEVDGATHHWFMGDGMVHGIRLREGRAEWYRNRYVGSSRLAELRGEPDIPGPNWNSSPVGPNTHVGGFAGTTWALVEAGGCPVELTYELETVGRNDFNGTLPGRLKAPTSLSISHTQSLHENPIWHACTSLSHTHHVPRPHIFISCYVSLPSKHTPHSPIFVSRTRCLYIA
jgi:carotenoid cleavage dioxygenase